MNKENLISAEEFERRFDNGESVLEYCDLTKVESAVPEHQSVNLELPQWMVKGLDKEAQRLGVTRQSIIKTLLSNIHINNTNKISSLPNQAQGALAGFSLGIIGTLSIISITPLNLNNHSLWYVSGALFGGSVGALICPISEDERRNKIRNEENRILQELQNLEKNYNPNNPIFVTRLRYFLKRLKNVEEELKTLQNSSNIRKIKEVKQEISPEQYDKTIKNYLEPSDSFETTYDIDLTREKAEKMSPNNPYTKNSLYSTSKYSDFNLGLTSDTEQDDVISDS